MSTKFFELEALNGFQLFRTGYNYDADVVSCQTGLLCLDPSLAQQQFKDDADINVIAKRFGLGYKMPDNIDVQALYGDVSGVTSFHDAVNVIAKAHESFDDLPADVRKRFANDVGAFVDFATNQENADELVKLGLAIKRESSPPPPPPPVSDDAGEPA